MPLIRLEHRCRPASLVLLLCLSLVATSCDDETVTIAEPTSADELIFDHYEEYIGAPRVERISEHVWVAISYDSAHVVLIHTEEGNVIVDTAMNPSRAKDAMQALEAVAPKAPVRAIIYTHSHLDHCGGTTAIASNDTPIWAHENFTDHFVKQYQLFTVIEGVRGQRQFGAHVSVEQVPSTGIGIRHDWEAPYRTGGLGMMYPTHTFSGTRTLEFGNLEVELLEAPGETHDHIVVWIPDDKTLIAGDNFYWAFPNLYTLRGTSPRAVSSWFESIDVMRRKPVEHLVPMHTKPIHGAAEIAEALTNYRDAMQWIRDEVVRGANQGLDLDTLAETIRLPEHLARHHYNREFRGKVDWCVRAIYTNNLGWFDGRPDRLFTHDRKTTAEREVELIGGPERLIESADRALEEGDPRWAIHLLVKLQDSGVESAEVRERLATAYETVARGSYNFDGRAYLLESALELREGMPAVERARINREMALGLPLAQLFDVMATRLDTPSTMDVHESVHFVFPDEESRFVVTIRRGVAEVVEGEPLPGTPEPIAILTMDSKIYREMALGLTSPLSVVAGGDADLTGSWTGFVTFFRRFL
jgi:alkyl sulfatase BDS1-like metallo-beta-lactamase superfamily hydrolase